MYNVFLDLLSLVIPLRWAGGPPPRVELLPWWTVRAFEPDSSMMCFGVLVVFVFLLIFGFNFFGKSSSAEEVTFQVLSWPSALDDALLAAQRIVLQLLLVCE